MSVETELTTLLYTSLIVTGHVSDLFIFYIIVFIYLFYFISI
jgi:hypothetical protein